MVKYLLKEEHYALECYHAKIKISVLEESLEKTELRLKASAFNLWLAAFSF